MLRRVAHTMLCIVRESFNATARCCVSGSHMVTSDDDVLTTFTQAFPSGSFIQGGVLTDHCKVTVAVPSKIYKARHRILRRYIRKVMWQTDRNSAFRSLNLATGLEFSTCPA